MTDIVRHSQTAWMAFWTAALLACAALWVFSWQKAEEPHEYAFRLPVLFLSCFHYRMADGETLVDWDVEQPTVFEVAGADQVAVIGGRFTACPRGAVFHLLESEQLR